MPPVPPPSWLCQWVQLLSVCFVDSVPAVRMKLSCTAAGLRVTVPLSARRNTGNMSIRHSVVVQRRSSRLFHPHRLLPSTDCAAN